MSTCKEKSNRVLINKRIQNREDYKEFAMYVQMVEYDDPKVTPNDPLEGDLRGTFESIFDSIENALHYTQ